MEKTKIFLSPLNSKSLTKLLSHVWNKEEFRSEYGLRSLSKIHKDHPAVFYDLSLYYEPGESLSKIKGGNSNWRGPVWFPMTYLLIETLLKLHDVFDGSLRVQGVTPREMASWFAESLFKLFQRDKHGQRPLYDGDQFLQSQEYILFYEHFHGDTGRGLGASHQTGWTGLIANLIDEFRA